MGQKPKNKMPISERAKQFAPFAAIRGLEAALHRKEEEMKKQQKPEMPEQAAALINERLSTLRIGEEIRIKYFIKGEIKEILAKFKFTNNGRIYCEELSLPLDSLISIN